MGLTGSSGRPTLFAVAVLIGAALLLPGGAAAAGVVNGDFEAGNLNGWSVHRTQGVGEWFAYTGTSELIAKERGRPLPQAPPQGAFAAISDQVAPETLILSQEIALEPGLSQRLSLLAFYNSDVPIAIPAPDTFSVDSEVLGGAANQQFRIDLMRAGSPLESLDPADILATVYRSELKGRPKDSKSMAPTWFSADLSAFAGQTVRLRIAAVANQELLTAGIDAVSIDHPRPGQPPLGSNRFSFGKLKLNRAKGTATLAVTVPGPGRLQAKGVGALPRAPKARSSKAAKPQALIKPVTVNPAKPGTVKLSLKPTAPALKVLRQAHKLQVPLKVTFTPAGGSPWTQTRSVVLKLKPPPRHR